MAHLTDPLARSTDTRPIDVRPFERPVEQHPYDQHPYDQHPLDLHPGATDPGLRDPRRPRRLVTAVVGVACVAALAVVVELAGTSGPLHSGSGTVRTPGAGVTAPAVPGGDEAPLFVPGGAGADGGPAGATAGGTDLSTPPRGLGGDGATTSDHEDEQPATDGGTDGSGDGTGGTTEEPGQPGQQWATVRISSPAHLTFTAGRHANLWAKATLDDGTLVAGGKLRWRVWSEPEHVLVYSHQGPNAFTPALPAGRYTVGISITDPTISGGLKRTIVFAQKGDLVLPTPSPVVTGPGSLAPQTPDGP